MSPSDYAQFASRISSLESAYNQTLIGIFVCSMLAGFAIGFIYAKYFHKETKPNKWSS